MKMTVSATETRLLLMLKSFLLIGLVAASFLSYSQDNDAQLKKWETEADTLMGRQDYAGAIKIYSKIISETGLKEKSQFKTLYKRAVAYYSLEESENGLKDISQFISEYPDVPRARLLRALIYRQLGDVDNQLVDLEKAMTDQNMNPELFRWRGSLFLEKEQFEKAKSDFTLVKNFTDDAELETNLGLIHYSLGHFDSALVCLNKAIELDVTYPASYIYAGSFCLQENQFERGLEYLNLALRIDSSNRTAIFYKGVALVELKRTEAGCSCLRKAFTAGEDDAADYLKEYCYEVYK
jgi:tetratricopeptide (TPR) repeat protein